MDFQHGDNGERFGQSGVRMDAQNLLDLVEASPFGILAIDLDGNIRIWNKAAEKISGWRGDEVLGQSIKLLPDNCWKIYEELHNRSLQKEVLSSSPMNATRKDGSTIQISYSIAPVLDDQSRAIGTMTVLYDISEKMNLEIALKISMEKMIRVLNQTTNALASAIEKRDPYTAGHQNRVAELASAIAEEMAVFDNDKIKGIKTAAMIHDIGKLYVPNEILSKPGRLTTIEFELLKTHPQAGYEILKGIEFPWPVACVVQQHHERMDGSGYPSGLSGESILLEARIVGVADVVEAMSSHRPYRPGKGIMSALMEIEMDRGSIFDPAVVDACLAVFKRGFVFTG